MVERLVGAAESRGRFDRPCGMDHRLGVRVQPDVGVGGQRRVAERALVVAALASVVRQQRSGRLDPVGVQLLEHLGDAPVQLPSPPQQDRAVGRVLREAVAERVLALGRPRGLDDQSAPFQGTERGREVGVARDGSQDRLGERPADHRCELQRVLGFLVERVEPCGEERLERRRDRDVDVVLVDRGGDLLEEQRVAVGALEDLCADGRVLVRDERVDQPPALVVGERGERELGRPVWVLRLEPLLQPPRRRFPIGPEREHEETRQLVDELCGLDQDVHRRLVAPVEVLEDHEPRLACPERPGRRRDELHDRVAERLALQGLLALLGDAEQRSPYAHVRVEQVFRAVFDRSRELGADHVRRIGVVDPGDPGDGSPVLRVRPGRVVGHALPGLPHPVEFGVAIGRCFVREASLPLGARLGDQPRLAEAGLTDERDDAAAARERFLDRVGELVELALAADERRITQPADRAVVMRAGGRRPCTSRRDRPCP